MRARTRISVGFVLFLFEREWKDQKNRFAFISTKAPIMKFYGNWYIDKNKKKRTTNKNKTLIAIINKLPLKGNQKKQILKSMKEMKFQQTHISFRDSSLLHVLIERSRWKKKSGKNSSARKKLIVFFVFCFKKKKKQIENQCVHKALNIREEENSERGASTLIPCN